MKLTEAIAYLRLVQRRHGDVPIVVRVADGTPEGLYRVTDLQMVAARAPYHDMVLANISAEDHDVPVTIAINRAALAQKAAKTKQEKSAASALAQKLIADNPALASAIIAGRRPGLSSATIGKRFNVPYRVVRAIWAAKPFSTPPTPPSPPP